MPFCENCTSATTCNKCDTTHFKRNTSTGVHICEDATCCNAANVDCNSTTGLGPFFNTKVDGENVCSNCSNLCK